MTEDTAVQPDQSVDTPPAQAQPSIADLEAQIAALRAQEQEAKQAACDDPILTQIDAVRDVDGNKPDFLTRLRHVTGNLVEAGKIIEQDLLTPAEQQQVAAVAHKLIGELVDKVASL